MNTIISNDYLGISKYLDLSSTKKSYTDHLYRDTILNVFQKTSTVYPQDCHGVENILSEQNVPHQELNFNK